MAAKKKPTRSLKRKRDKRPSAAKRGYNYKWQKKRNKRLTTRTRCTSCGRVAGKSAHLHHSGKGIKPKCRSCHNRISAKNKARKKVKK